MLCTLRHQVKPEAKTYYELGAAKLKFVFPRPGFLEGIKMRSQPISIMTQARSPHHLGSLPSACALCHEVSALA